MESFSNEFWSAEQICRRIFEQAATCKSLNNARAQWRFSSRFLLLDMKTLQSALCREEDGRKTYPIIGRITANKKFDVCGLTLMNSLATDFLHITAMIARRSGAKASGAQLPDDGEFDRRLTNVLFKSCALAELFGHVAAIDAGRDVTAYFVLATGQQPRLPLSPERIASAKVRHTDLAQKYRARLAWVQRKLYALGVDYETINELWTKYQPCDHPVWINKTEQPGSTIINDVWFPAEYAAPVRTRLASEQTKATAGAQRIAAG